MPGHSFLGPGTKALYRLDLPEDTQHIPLTVNPQEWSKPIGYLDEQAMYHDIAYFNAERNPNFTKEQILDEKHNADERMLAAIAKYEPNGLIDRFHKFVIEKAIGLKLHFGLGFTEDQKEQIAKELHSPIRHKFPRRKVIVNHIDEIWACDLIDFSKEPFYHKKVRYNYVLVIVDCFSKYCRCFCIKNKTPEQIIDCY